MEAAILKTAAIWTVLVVPFVALAGFLSARNQLGLTVVAVYWFPPIALVVIGTIPAPWQPLAG